MNNRKQHPGHSTSTSPDDAVDEREWLAQEGAARAERLGIPGGMDGDPLVAGYREVSRALRQPLADGPPPDFASDLARHVAIEDDVTGDRFERVVLQVMTALLGLSLGVICVLYGRDWLQATAYAASEGALQWTALVACCVALHWVLERWRIRADPR